jgi:SpoVK/Ycf46/Vps4 family AAA+-type ATPase
MSDFKPKLPPAAQNKFERQTATETSIRQFDFKVEYKFETPKKDDVLDTVSASDMRDSYRRIWSLYSDELLFGGGPNRSASAPVVDRAYEDARSPVKQWLHKASSQSTGWDDVVGNETAKTALLEAIEHPHAHKDLYTRYGIKPSKGVLLYGPPGCGKTMFAKAAASAIARLHGKDVEYMLLRANEIDSKYVGKTEANIRRVFAFARAYKKKHGHSLLIFIDEADALLPNRNTVWQFSAQNVATFLAEMDGLDENGAFMMLATNRPDTIDEAVLRDGRIDRKVKVERPGYEAALLIAAKAIATAPLAGATVGGLVEYLFDPTHLLRALTNPETGNTHHFALQHIVSGAMIVGLVERAKGIAMRRDLAEGTVTGLTQPDMRAAVESLFAESKGLNHDYALREFVETVAIPFDQAKLAARLN